MPGWRYRGARYLLAQRRVAFVTFALITLFFLAGLPRVKLETIFSDLLPTGNDYVEVFRDHPGFGSPLTMTVMVKTRDGTIYNAETLQKIYDLTWQLDLAPAVDHDLILSIASDKARVAESTPNGIRMRPVMDARPPDTETEIAAFRERVQQAPRVQGFLVSPDESATLLQAIFTEHRINYGESFRYVQQVVEDARDARHEVHLAGQPALIGWVYLYESEMAALIALSVLLLFLALLVYQRSVAAVIIPLFTSSVAAIWAFGFVGWLDIPIEPLLMVVPLLLIARSFSHSVQFYERFREIQAIVGDREEAAARTLDVMLGPSVLSILTDALGIAVLAAAPIPAIARHAVFCGMWALWLIPTGVVLITLLLATLPEPATRARAPAGRSRRGRDILGHALAGVARLSTGRAKLLTAGAIAIGAALALLSSLQLEIGNPVAGSALLRQDSEYNVAARQINAHFPGTNTIEIVLEARRADDPRWTAQHADTLQTLIELQRLLETGPFPPTATLSFADYVMDFHRMFNGGNPKWLFIAPTQAAASGAAFSTILTNNPKNLTHVMTYDGQHLALSAWYPDNRQDTVDRALAAARSAIDQVGREHDAFTIRLGTGVIPLQDAINSVVERYHLLIVLLLDGCILLMFSLAYRSLAAGLLLLVPVNLAHVAMMACMQLLGVGLDINSLIVAAIGLGVGIDYGIYLLSRIREEYRRRPGWDRAIQEALQTTGRAIGFTAGVMALGILPLYLLSDLKFVADMGLFIMAIMGINMVAALVVLPLLINLLRPNFVARGSAMG